MTAMYPNNKPWDYTFLRYLQEEKNNDKTNISSKIIDNNTIFSFIQTNPQFSDFLKIVEIANMTSILSNKSKHLTLLLPILCNVDLLTLDTLEARKLVMLCLLPSKFYDRDFITGLYDTSFKNYQLWIDDGIINKKSKIVVANILRDNGIIHIINKLPI